MFQRVFDPLSPFWQGIGKFADVLMLSILWLFLSLPVVTLGAATAALYDATARCVVGGAQGPLGRFWATFKRELRTGTAATLIWGGVCALLIWGVWALRERVAFEGAAAVIVLALWYAVLLLPVGMLCWMFPTLSRFTLPAGRLIPTAARLAMGYFPRTILIVLSALAGVLTSVWLTLPMLAAPCLVAMAWTKLMEGVFRRYAGQDGPGMA